MVTAAAMLVVASLSAAAVQAARMRRKSSIEPEVPSQPLAKVENAPSRPNDTAAAAEPMEPIDPVHPVDVNDPRHVARVGPSRAPAARENRGVELDILQAARSAVALGDLAAALDAIAAHERRYPDGQLTEEREALRILALAGLRRMDDARGAAAAFRKRFPDSVLLRRMNETVRATP
jgi:TolA-binding protein